MVSLFRGHRARVMPLVGETQEDTTKRAWKEIDDSSLKITLSMKHPERIKLIWEELE